MSHVSTRSSFPADRNVGRRSFLKGSVISGLGSSIIYTGSQTVMGADDPQCVYRLSAVEALSMFTDLLFRIQSDSFTLLGRRIEAVAVDCQEQFKKLCESVNQLAAELRKSGSTNSDIQVQQMKALAEIGCSSATQLVNSPSPQGSLAAVLRSLETINKEIGLAAQQLLPEGETVLSPEATRVLRVIVTQVHQSAAIQRSIDDARKATRESRDLIVQSIQSIQRLLFDAGSEILVADEGNSVDGQNARSRAARLLGEARQKLKGFIDNLKARQLYSDKSPGDSLLLVLDGTKQWVSDPASVGASPAISYKNDEMRFLTIRDVTQPHSGAPFISFNPAEVAELLRNFCPPDGAVHVSQVITAMTSVVGWTVAMRVLIALGVRGPLTAEEVLNAVRLGLNALRLSCRPHKNCVPNPEKLAQELARIIMT